MALPSIGFDLQDLIDEGLIVTEEPASADFPKINVTAVGLVATLNFLTPQLIGELFDVYWGDADPDAGPEIVTYEGGTHTYAAPGNYGVTVYQHGSTNWFSVDTITVAAV
jgi:hypothetical protein